MLANLCFLWPLFNIAESALYGRGHVWIHQDNVMHSIIFVFGGILLAAIMRSVLKDYPKIRFLHYAAVIVYGILFGFVCTRFPTFNQSFGGFARFKLRDIAMLYIPVITFKIAFCIEHYAFFKALKQILIISILSCTLNIIFTGYIMATILDQDWNFVEIIHFGMITYPIYPSEIMKYLTHIGTHTKHIVTLLEGESLMGFTNIMSWSALLVVYYHDPTTGWYAYFETAMITIPGGFLTGLILGLLGRVCLKLCRHDDIDLVVITVCLAFIASYILCVFYVSTLGVLSVAVVGLLLNAEISAFPPKTSNFLRKFWSVNAEVSNIVVLLCHGIAFAFKVIPNLHPTDISMTFVTYVISLCGRFISILVFMPILSRIGWGLKLDQMLACCWGGLKSPIILILSLLYHKGDDEDDRTSQVYIMHSSLLYLWALIINGTTLPMILDVLGVTHISVMKIFNMNTCMRIIAQTKDRAIDILKMDRFFADANWEVVQKYTTIIHPYEKEVHKTDNTLEVDVFGGQGTICPECQADVPYQPTETEFREMIKEARIRVLKARKISYARQFEFGMLSKKALRFLTTEVDCALDDKDVAVDMRNLEKLFNSLKFCHYIFRKYIQTIYTPHPDTKRVPKNMFHRCCFRIISNPAFDYFIFALIIANVFTIFWCLERQFKDTSKPVLRLHLLLSLPFNVCFTLECFLKIMGYSWIYVWQHGVKTYFKSWLNRLDFGLLIASYVNITMYLIALLLPPGHESVMVAVKVIAASRIMRIFRIVRLFRLLKPCYPSILLFWDGRADVEREYAFLVGNGYLTASREILRVLTTMIDNEAVREDIKVMLETENGTVIKWMGATQKDRPWIAVTVKTRQTSRAVLNHMRDAVYELKSEGWTDLQEHHKLKESLDIIDKAVLKIKAVHPCTPRVLFGESIWLGGEENIISYLFKNIAMKKYDTDDVVVSEGEIIDGILFLVTGLLMQRYFPTQNVLTELKNTGSLPIIDYINCNQYGSATNTLIVPGNTLGGLCTLTGRPYNCMVSAAEYSQVFLIKKEFLLRAIDMDPDPVDGLEARIWKVISIRLALTILTGVPAYQYLSHEKISFILQRGFVPDLSYYKILIKNQLIMDIILVEGIVVDFNTRDIYTAPCYIPRTVHRLMLPKNSISAVTKKPVQTKLLILPEKDVDEYDIMESEQETGEMIASDSAKCLRHIAIVKYKMRRKMKAKKSFGFFSRKKGEGSEISKGRSTAAFSATKSHITFSGPENRRLSTRGSSVSKAASHNAVHYSASKSLRSIKEEATESSVSLVTDVFNEKIKKKPSE